MLDIFNAFDVSASGMYAERIRMNTIASNLANYESYKTDGTPYQKLEPVFQAVYDKNMLSDGLVPVNVSEIRQSNGFKLIYDPSNPHANAQGYVEEPNINVTTEMVDMITATESYQANLSAFNMTKNIAQFTINSWT
jgi:flagellar basal-body rod protein FlgC